MIMRSDGTLDPGPKTDYHLNDRPLLARSDVVIGDGFLEFNGRWRLGDADGVHSSSRRLGDADGVHFSLQHRNGTVAVTWSSDGTQLNGPLDGYGTWSKPRRCGRVEA